MEFNHQTAEKPDQIRWSTDDQTGVGQVRSYTCAFCRRGFSNAQALGGHMNIHRRHRAKLKQQSSEENLLSLEISVKNSTDSGCEDQNTNNHKKPNIFPNNINGHESQRVKFLGAAEIQLPLFAGRHNKMRATSVMVESIEEKKKITELNHVCSSKVELDLELRLGPEPLQEAPPLNTREFF